MSTKRWIELTCDVTGCGTASGPFPNLETSQAKGWRRRPRSGRPAIDLCPGCSARYRGLSRAALDLLVDAAARDLLDDAGRTTTR